MTFLLSAPNRFLDWSFATPTRVALPIFLLGFSVVFLLLTGGALALEGLALGYALTVALECLGVVLVISGLGTGVLFLIARASDPGRPY